MAEHTCYKDDPPQYQVAGEVRLIDDADHQVFLGIMQVWRGKPVGDWVEFHGKRIGLRVVRGLEFEGIVRNP